MRDISYMRFYVNTIVIGKTDDKVLARLVFGGIIPDMTVEILPSGDLKADGLQRSGNEYRPIGVSHYYGTLFPPNVGRVFRRLAIGSGQPVAATDALIKHVLAGPNRI